jgi:hypothetical protein
LTFLIPVAACLLISTGCEDLIPPRPPIGPASQAENGDAIDSGNGDSSGPQAAGQQVSASDDAGSLEEPQRFSGDWEHWYLHRFGSQVVGVSHIRAREVFDASFAVAEDRPIRFERSEQLIYRTGRIQFIRHMDTTSVESADGQVTSLESELQTGPLHATLKGVRRRNAMALIANDQRGRVTQQLDWGQTTRGPFAVEQSLRRRPIEKGESRKIKAVLPSFKSVGEVRLDCPGDSSIAMLDGRFESFREVEVRWFDQQQVVDSWVVWVDQDGSIVRTLRPNLRLESLRTDRATANRRFVPRDGSAVLVAVEGRLNSQQPLSQVAFVVAESTLAAKAAGTDAAGIMVLPIARQYTRRVADGLQVLVSTDPSIPDGFQGDQSEPSVSDLEPSPIVDWQQSNVADLAKSVGELPADAMVRELSRVAHNQLSLQSQSEIRAASAVLRSRQGGPIDHAVLLAAMLRARELPARIVLGLRPAAADVPSIKGSQAASRTMMELSAWVLTHFDGNWHSIDPLTSELNRPDCLCLRQVSDDRQLQSAIVEVFRRLADIEIEIRGAR